MCGIAGIARRDARRDARSVDEAVLLRMTAALRHRGPDGIGLRSGERVGLAHTRLSIIDIVGGAQPLTNEDGRVAVTYDGEVYNHLELRRELEGKGHRFRTATDSEVLVHAYEQWGETMLHRLNGQFAFAIYDQRNESVFLARDRFGVRPLYYAHRNNDLYFASEMKALFATGEVPAAAELAGLDEVFTFWASRAPRTPFHGVHQLEPGTFAVWRDGRLRHTRYYRLGFPEAHAEPHGALETLDEILQTSVQMRMRADVPIGGYLSGGLDSSVTASLAARSSPHKLRTFSVTFEDPRLDESVFQQVVAEAIGSEHSVVAIKDGDIARVFPDVIWHSETPLVRSAPAPLYLLSRLTRECGIKAVLAGEGADEIFLGYDIFKETTIRRFCLRQPASVWRPRLFDRLYPHLSPGARGSEFWRRSFLAEAAAAEDLLFSHMPRFLLTSRIKDFYSAEMRIALAGADVIGELRQSLPPEFASWSAVNRAAYLEIVTLLSSYLLSAQGDRMAMAHGVEARFPFLDHRLFEFAAALPESSKLRGLRDKQILRRWADSVVPARVRARRKQPYCAPEAPAFFGPRAAAYVAERLDCSAVKDAGIFDAAAVGRLVKRCRAGRASGFAENQALVGILSTQLWHERFLSRSARPSIVAEAATMRHRALAGVS
jgi:asparagine synthase (glutamine-hydrolysing)